MLDERSQAYANLREAAESLLSRPGDAAARVLGPATGLVTFSITWQPSFEPCVGYAVLTKPERSGAPTRRVCRVAWDPAVDLRRVEEMSLAAVKLRPPEPTLQVAVVDAPPEVGEWLHDVHGIRVPPALAEAGGGLDGELTTVRFGNVLQHSEYRWWCEGPKEWAPLVAWAARVRGRLDRLFAPEPAP